MWACKWEMATWMRWQGRNATMGGGAAGQDTRSPRFSEMPTCSELPVSAHGAKAKEGGDIHIIFVVRTYIT